MNIAGLARARSEAQEPELFHLSIFVISCLGISRLSAQTMSFKGVASRHGLAAKSFREIETLH